VLYVLLLILTLDNTVTDVALLTLARDLREHHCAAAVTFPERLPPSVALAREEQSGPAVPDIAALRAGRS
jgi:hypothetical protein